MGVKVLKRFTLFLRDGFRCLYCDTLGLVPRGIPQDEDLTVDHLYAKSKGGSNRLRNIFASCLICNHNKGHQFFALDRHPRVHREFKNRKSRNKHWGLYKKCMGRVFALFKEKANSKEEQREQIAEFLNEQIIDWCLSDGDVTIRDYVVQRILSFA